MGAELCGHQGAQYLCNNRHTMMYISLEKNPEDILNETTPQENKICIFCSKNVEDCQSKVAWGCQKCKFYYCAKCKGYKVDVCPRNHSLQAKQDFKPKDDAFCDICATPILQKAQHCNKCKFNVCPTCNQAIKNKKK